MNTAASLYIHIPFCAGACDYCDFYSVAANSAGQDEQRLDQYVTAVLADIEDQFSFSGIRQVPTVYIGGGTPSVLGARRVGRLLAGLSSLLSGMDSTPVEFTVEANPESADDDFLQTCRTGGVNRLSLGIQSFYEPSRRAIHRLGNANILDERLALAARYFPGAFSADLISGLPFQTENILLDDIKRLLAFEPSHVSLYSLTVEQDTPLEQNLRQGMVSLPDISEADALWLIGRDALEQAGFPQYEISNFALPEKYCVHNLRYWRMESWLAAGPAASGTIINDETGTGRRLSYAADIDAYLVAPRPAFSRAIVEELDQAVLMRESLLMGFRCGNGPDAVLFQRRFGRGIAECIPRAIARWQEQGFFENAAAPALAPSRKGMLFLDAFLRDVFFELEKNNH